MEACDQSGVHSHPREHLGETRRSASGKCLGSAWRVERLRKGEAGRYVGKK